ncbi:hypothetical protein OG218_14880 [Kineococcus sp. NBC_00420]|uniref:hypothetical protein n=1 Tax=Kineococcus sp. NBC_00420 TaxID=2903564 RepID=UPI002E1E3F64
MNDLEVRPVDRAEHDVVAWLWQCFRHDLALVVSALPYPDGRYQTQGLPSGADGDVATYLAWRPHPRTGEAAPVGFAVVAGSTGERRAVTAFWAAPVARRDGVGRRLALDVLGRHAGPWDVVFQHDNLTAGRFWRRIADEVFGPGGWREEEREVPGLPQEPPDHWITT